MHYITKQGPNTVTPQAMGGSLNNESTTTEPLPLNGQPNPLGRDGAEMYFNGANSSP